MSGASARRCAGAADERMMQLMRMMNRLLDKAPETRRRHLSFHTPVIVPIWPQARARRPEIWAATAPARPPPLRQPQRGAGRPGARARRRRCGWSRRSPATARTARRTRSTARASGARPTCPSRTSRSAAARPTAACRPTRTASCACRRARAAARPAWVRRGWRQTLLVGAACAAHAARACTVTAHLGQPTILPAPSCHAAGLRPDAAPRRPAGVPGDRGAHGEREHLQPVHVQDAGHQLPRVDVQEAVLRPDGAVGCAAPRARPLPWPACTRGRAPTAAPSRPRPGGGGGDGRGRGGAQGWCR